MWALAHSRAQFRARVLQARAYVLQAQAALATEADACTESSDSADNKKTKTTSALHIAQ